MKTFTTLDYAVVVGYMFVIAIIGSSFYRRNITQREYFLSGRSMSWLPVGISIIAADLSAISVMGVPAWGFQHNLELIWVAFGYPLMVPVLIFVVIPFYTRLNLYTAYEYLERRFNLGVRLVTSFLFQVLRGMHVGIAIYAPALIISLVSGLRLWECILFMGLFTTAYTALGGMKAVIWTDVIQFFMVTGGIGLTAYMAISHVEGGIVSVYHTALDAGSLKLFNFSADPSQLSSTWGVLMGGTVLAFAAFTTDQVMIQRLFTTKSHRDCVQSVLFQSAVVIPLNLLLYLTGTALFVFYRYHPASLAGLNSPDSILPFFAVHELPRGVSGLIIASIFASSMGVISAGVNALTTATTVDFYQRLLYPDKSPQHYAFVGRIGTAIWGIAATSFALFAAHLGALMNAYSRVASFILGPLLGIFLLGFLTKRATATGALLGAAIGTVAVFIVAFRTSWSFFFQSPIGLIFTLVAGYLASLITKPPSDEKIRGFVVTEPDVAER